MEMTRTEKAVAALLALGAMVALTLALTAPAKAASYGNGFQVAKFKVEIKGWQHSVSHRTIESEEECGLNDHSFGRERITFRTIKPVYLTATHMRGEFNPQLFGGRQLGIPVVAKVQRSFMPAIGFNAGDCEENGGGAEPSVPDCGTKVVKPWRLELQFGREKKNGLLLSGYGGEDPFDRCSSSGVASFPELLVEGSGHKGKYIYAELSQDELFDPHFQKWISLANGSARESSDGLWEKTEIHWAVSFTRLGEKKGKKH